MRSPVPSVEHFHHRSAPSSSARCLAAARLLLAPVLAVAGLAQAVGLGEISQQSAFGAPLRIVVPLIVGPGENLSGECVKLSAAPRSGDGIPEITSARVVLESTSAGAQIVVTSPRVVADPVLKLTLQAGCDSGVRREYMMLMDPVPIDVPVAEEGSRRTADAAPAVADGTGIAGGSASAAGVAVAPSAARAPRPSRPPRAPARRRAAATAPTTVAAPTTVTPKTAAAPAARPKLTVSAAAPPAEALPPGKGAAATAARGTPARSAPSDASAELDAEAAALRQRVAELTAMVDRMQDEMRAADARQAAQAARLAAENAAKVSPQATLGRWWNESWPLLVGIVGLAALIAAVLSYRRRRASAAASQWRIDPPSRAATEVPSRAAIAVPPSAPRPAPAAAEAAPRRGEAAPVPPSSVVDVTELAHVTEEAGVYLAFNRPDRAIDVLHKHILASPHSLPAAWLMLLDLYHTHGREQEFQELAQRFHSAFNAETPAWDGYRRPARNDRGIEAFPHLVRQLSETWGGPASRELLDGLLHENRDGRRQGFSLAAYEDILFLRQLAEAVSDGAATTQRQPATAGASARAPRADTPVAKAARPPTLDLELALDEDLLDSGAAPPPGGPTAPKGAPRNG